MARADALFIEYVFWGEAHEKDMDLWDEDFLSGGGIGDYQMIATVGWSEFLEETLRSVAVRVPPTTFPDLQWEHGVFEAVRRRLGSMASPDARLPDIRAMGVHGWPRETQLVVEDTGPGGIRSWAWPLWDPSIRAATGEVPGDPEQAAATILKAMLSP